MSTIRGIVLALGLIGATAWAAEGDLPAAPVEDAVKLTKSGLGDEVLLAWVQAHRAYSALSAAQIVGLKEAGVSEPVIAAMIQRGGTRAAMQKVAEYEVPVTTSTRSASNVISQADYERAKQEYRTTEAATYTYAQPAGSTYETVRYSYPSTSYISVGLGYSSYPYYYGGYYPRYYGYSSCYYPRYYSSGYRYYGGLGYYGRGYYGGYYGGHHHHHHHHRHRR